MFSTRPTNALCIAGLSWLERMDAPASMLQIPPRIFWWLVGLALVVGVGVAANPFIVNPPSLSDTVGDGMVKGIGLTGLGWCLWAVIRRWRRRDVLDWCELNAGIPQPSSPLPVSAGGPSQASATAQIFRDGDELLQFEGASGLYLSVSGLVLLAFWLLLFRERIVSAELYSDDFEYVETAKDWPSVRARLLVPGNGQFTAVVRFVTWAVCAAVPADAVPAALAGLVMILFVAAWPLIFVFLFRELSSTFLALLGVCLFALTRAHQEVILWYSAGIQFLVSLHLLLIGLIALQGMDRPSSSRVRRLGVSCICSFLAPLCGSPGLLVGPVSAVYLACGSDRRDAGRRFWGRVLVPLVGTAAGVLLLVLLLRMGEAAANSVRDPLRALHNGVRATVDILLLGNLGFDARWTWPRWVYVGAFSLAIGALVELLRKVQRARWTIFGIALIVLSAVLIMAFRSWVSYEELRCRTRYQLFAQFGLSVLVVGVVGELRPELIGLRQMRPRDLVVFLLLASVLYVVHAAQPAYIGG